MKTDIQEQFFYTALIRLHILHHAVKKPFFGLWMIEELAEHGYKTGPGTLYPLLHGLEKKGFLISYQEKSDRKNRKFYKATSKGRKALTEARAKLKELLTELSE